MTRLRILSVGALALVLGGCVGSGGSTDVEALRLSAAQDDSHCRSLKLEQGSLVYVQCRLALRKTYLNDYQDRKLALREAYGPLSDELDQAVRTDTFCNYDESVQAGVQRVAGQEAAETAYQLCEEPRARLAETLSSDLGIDGRAYVAAERPQTLARNLDAVREANAVLDGFGI